VVTLAGSGHRSATLPRLLVGQHRVDDLAVLVNRPVRVPPPARHRDICFVDESAVTAATAAAAGGVDEDRGERLDRAVDADVVDHDTALGRQVLDVACECP